MPGAAAASRAFGLQRWIGLPAARAHCVCHFLGIAATLAAAKVLLSTIAVTLFVAEQGAAGLPPFYVAFAAIAIVLSFGLGAIIDRAAKVRLAQITFAVLLGGTAALRLLLALEVPGVSFALLASATAFEIILDIVFWVVVAAYLDAFEFRRATPLVYMALALGGAAGGVLARLGAGYLPAADMLLLLPPLAALVVAQFGAVARRLHEIPEHHPDTAQAEAGLGPLQLGRLLRRYPLALLIALNALVVTLLYGLSEFLILTFYGERFASEAELAEFLSLLFALMQVVEFGLLYTLTRLLLERTGPLVRNLVFPLTSLASIVFLIASPRLLAVVLMHINIEAASNAIFLPVGNANYVPLPLGFQGRARTLSEGIFYPIGLALAGVVLWSADPDTAWLQVEFAALVFAGLFLLLSAGIGFLFLPTLRDNVGAGLITPGQAIAAAPLPAPRVRTLLHSREPELRLLGLALAQRLDPAPLEADLLRLARHHDQAARTALARLVAAAPRAWTERFLERCLAGGGEQAKLALLVLLLRQARPRPEQLARLLAAQDPVLAALAHLAADGGAAWPRVQPLVQSPEVAAELVAAIVGAERADLDLPLAACLASVAPEQQCRALAMLNGATPPPGPAALDLLRPLARCGDAAVRAEAIVLLSRTAPRSAAVRRLLDGLADPDRQVRRRAGAALAEHGDRALALLRRRLADLTVATVDVVHAVAGIASPRTRPLLAAFVRTLQQDAERTASLLERSAAAPDRARCAALELCLCDHRARLIDVAMAVLSPAIEPHLERRVREALQSADQRSRASAYELVVAAPASRLVPGAVGLLRYLLFEDGPGRAAGGQPDADAALRREAMASTSPWVRRAAARLGGPPEPMHKGDLAMALEDQELERVVALKRTPLFRYVPFETVLAVARAGQPRTYLAGEQVSAEAGRQELLILEAGALSVEHPGGASTLAAPACLGEAALVGEPAPWPRIIALEDCRIWFLRAALFEELCHDHPQIAIELCRLLARRMHDANGAAHAPG